MGFVFDHSSPHPGRMGEIYEDEDYIPMSPIPPDPTDGIRTIDISHLGPLLIAERNPIRLPEVCELFAFHITLAKDVLTIGSGELETKAPAAV
ncbi:unnamed protein product [Penicillium manginii]